MQFNRLTPELSVTHIEKSLAFYKMLGFHVKYERKEDKFAFIELDGNQLMIEERNNHWNTGIMEYPFGRGINISMTVDDIDAMYQALKEKNIVFFLELEVHSYKVKDKIYNDKEFLVQDPDGYLLRFNN